jgi:hypothetical protein
MLNARFIPEEEEAMANYTPTQAQKEAFIAQMTQRMAEVAQKLADWVTAKPRTLEEAEEITLQSIKELGNALLGSLISLNVPAYPEEEVPCPCGQKATYQHCQEHACAGEAVQQAITYYTNNSGASSFSTKSSPLGLP